MQKVIIISHQSFKKRDIVQAKKSLQDNSHYILLYINNDKNNDTSKNDNIVIVSVYSGYLMKLRLLSVAAAPVQCAPQFSQSRICNILHVYYFTATIIMTITITKLSVYSGYLMKLRLLSAAPMCTSMHKVSSFHRCKGEYT